MILIDSIYDLEPCRYCVSCLHSKYNDNGWECKLGNAYPSKKCDVFEGAIVLVESAEG